MTQSSEPSLNIKSANQSRSLQREAGEKSETRLRVTTNVETSQRLKVESGDWSKTEQIMIGKSKKTEELLMCLVTYKESEQKTKKLHSSTGILQTSYSSL